MKEITLKGNTKEGLRIASGQSLNPPLVEGMNLNNTIALQRPFFEEAGIIGISNMYSGTINVDISPNKFEILKPDYEITCEWWEGLIETFWLVETKINFNNEDYDGYIYYPCPSYVKSHDDYTVEFLTYKIPNLNYGDEIFAKVSGEKIRLF